MRQPSHLQERVFPKPECHLDIGFVSSLQLAQLTFKRLADGLATTLEKKSVTFVSESTTGLTPQSPQIGTINRRHCLEAFLGIRGVWDLNVHNCYKSEGAHFPALRLGPALQAYKISSKQLSLAFPYFVLILAFLRLMEYLKYYQGMLLPIQNNCKTLGSTFQCAPSTPSRSDTNKNCLLKQLAMPYFRLFLKLRTIAPLCKETTKPNTRIAILTKTRFPVSRRLRDGVLSVAVSLRG